MQSVYHCCKYIKKETHFSCCVDKKALEKIKSDYYNLLSKLKK